MLIYDDSNIDSARIINRAGRREISIALHDIDGTHSLIRDWPPVMSLSLHYAMTGGLPDDFDSDENLARLIPLVGVESLDETDRFCIESAGLSALTQMEWALRRAVEMHTIDHVALGLGADDLARNASIIARIWAGEERFPDEHEPEGFTAFLAENTPRLFKLYAKILKGACRDRNMEIARKDPARFRVQGSLSFMTFLRKQGVKNYFITGAVVASNEQSETKSGMAEEVEAVGFEVGPGKLVEELHGSTWNEKTPKNEVMARLIKEMDLDPANILVIGDGRSEVAAGIAMGSLVWSRLPADATRQRELHRCIGTHVIVEDFLEMTVREFFPEVTI